MITFARGNLLEADVEAAVNTVNTVGVMGKGIARMFKERFPENFKAYEKACKDKELRIGKMFVSENREFFGPKWIVNFPTKTHWRVDTRLEWIEEGLRDLVRVIRDKNISSIAIPPLGCGNGGLDWHDVRPLLVTALEEVEGLDAVVYEPTARYQNVTKRNGVENLTPARALVAEMVRRYSLLGIDCSILEVQKLAWFIERGVKRLKVKDPLKFRFAADRFGPYSHNLQQFLDALDGSYLHCDKRLADAGPLDLIWFNNDKKDKVSAYLNSGEGKAYSGVLEWASSTIDGFESPFGMELLATVDWLLEMENVESSVERIMDGLRRWAGGKTAGQRKLRIFNKRSISLALTQLGKANQIGTSHITSQYHMGISKMTDDELVDKVWERARPIRGKDPNKVRKDPYGNQIKRDQYGHDGPQGWEIDHIKPASRGGSDHLRNLQAMQTGKNRQLGDTLKKRSRHSRT